MSKIKLLPLPKDPQFFLKRLNPGDQEEKLVAIDEKTVTFGTDDLNELEIKNAFVASFHGEMLYGSIDGVEGWYLRNFDEKFGTFYDGVHIGKHLMLVHPGVPIRVTEDASSTFVLEVRSNKKQECKPSSSSYLGSIYAFEQMSGDDVFLPDDPSAVKLGFSSDSRGSSIAKNSGGGIQDVEAPLGDVTNVSNIRKRKADVDHEITPKRKLVNVNLDTENERRECASGSSEVVLHKRLHPLKTYLDAIEASDVLIKYVNAQTRSLSQKFMNLLAKSVDDRTTCCDTSTLNSKGKVRTIVNQLVRGRIDKEGSGYGNTTSSKIKIIDSCLLKNICCNLFHRNYEMNPNEQKPIKLGEYRFSKGSGKHNYWRCIDCNAHQENLRRHGKKYNLYGYLQFNTNTGKLEDKTRKNKNDVDSNMPGGKPHICQGKAVNDNIMKIEKCVEMIKKYKESIKERKLKFEREIDALVKDADEEAFSDELKTILQRFRGSFGYDTNHRRFFVYFITYLGDKNILYYGISSNPENRLYHHRTQLFHADVKNGKVLEMHLLPLGTINSLFAGELETAFIRLSQNGDLKDGKEPVRNKHEGYYSKKKFLKPIIDAKYSDEYRSLMMCLDELVQVTFDQGKSISSQGLSHSAYDQVNQIKKRLTKCVKFVRAHKASTACVNTSLTSDNHPPELQEYIESLKRIFVFKKDDVKYYLYFFTLAGNSNVLYYGITTNPAQRYGFHGSNTYSPMYKFFKSKKELHMHLISLGNINRMFAEELETILIRLSKDGFLMDGNKTVNRKKGVYSSKYNCNEATVLSGDGEEFESLLKNMNDLIAATIGSNNFISK